MRIFITLTLLVFLVSDTLSSSHDQPVIGPSQITKLIDKLKYHEQQETYIETKIQQTVENLKAAAADVSNQINGFITRKRKVKKETLMKLKELELKLSKLKTSVKECLQRLIKANQKRSGQKDHQKQEAEGDDQEEEASGVEGEEENEQKPFRDVEIKEQEDELLGPSGVGSGFEDEEDYEEKPLDDQRDTTEVKEYGVDQEGPSGEGSGDEAGESGEDGGPLDEQEESSGIDDEEVDEQEQKPFRDVEIEEQEDEQPGPSGRGHYGFPLSASWEDWEDYVEQFLDGRRDFTEVDQEGPSGEGSGDEAGESDEDEEPLDEQEEGNETDEEPLLEHGGSIGVEDEEDDEQEQGLMDGLREPTEVKKQDDDNRKESRSRRVGSSPQPPQPPQSPQPPHAPHHEIEEINHKKLLDEVEESTKAEDSQRKISRSESVTKEQSGQSNTSGKKLISIAGSLQLS